MCFVWISEQTAIISLYSVNWLDVTECLLRGTDWVLNVTQVNLRFKRVTLFGVPAWNRNVAPRECYRLNEPAGSCWTAIHNAAGTSVDLKIFRTEARTGLQSSVGLRGERRTIYSTFCVVVVGTVAACCRVQLKHDGTRCRTWGEVKRKLANGVGSQYPSHYHGTWCIQHYYRWCAHLDCH